MSKSMEISNDIRQGPLHTLSLLSSMLRIDEPARADVIDALRRLSDGDPNGEILREARAGQRRQLGELISKAYVTIPFEKFSGVKKAKRIEERAPQIVNLTRLIDGRIKNDERVKMNGLALVYSDKPDTAVIVMEHEEGSEYDLKSVLDGASARGGSIAPYFTAFMPVTFTDYNLRRGNISGWAEAVFVDCSNDTSSTEVKMSVLDAWVSDFLVKEKPTKKIYAADITDQVNSQIAKSGIREGHALVATRHTTHSIITHRLEQFDSLKDTLLALAPGDIEYMHNKTAGDNNGRYHLMAEFLGAFVLHRVRGGRLDIGGNTVLSVDLDDQKPRDRGVVVAVF